MVTDEATTAQSTAKYSVQSLPDLSKDETTMLRAAGPPEPTLSSANATLPDANISRRHYVVVGTARDGLAPVGTVRISIRLVYMLQSRRCRDLQACGAITAPNSIVRVNVIILWGHHTPFEPSR